MTGIDTDEPVRTQIDQGVCTITLCDERRRNALSRPLVTRLNSILDQAEADDEVRVIVLTNSGTVFCAGADLSERSSGHTSAPQSGPDQNPTRLFARFAELPKPVVGRIAGHCVAGGMGLAAAMDIAIADETVKMGFTEVRIGVAPAIISVLCLPKMRAVDAAEVFLRGRRFTATEAAELGLIARAVPADRLDAEVASVVDDLLAAGPKALAACKQLLARVPTMDTDAAFAWTGQLSARLFSSAEAAEGMTAYLEKRPAAWIPSPDNDSEAVADHPSGSDPKDT